MSDQPAPTSVSVVIPCFNESATIAEIVRRVRAADTLGLTAEVIVVDDGSTDGTRNLLEGPLRGDIDTLLLRPANGGKGAALVDGFGAATSDLVLVQDADLEYDSQDYPRLLRQLVDGRAEVVYSSRFIGGREHRVLFFWHMVANRVLTTLSNMATNLNLTDMECGYKVMRRHLLDGIDLREQRFGIEPELTAKLAKRRVVVYEVGITYHGRTYAEDKKIGWRDAVRAVWVIVRNL